jgi:Flp pilus assembly protein TadD
LIKMRLIVATVWLFATVALSACASRGAGQTLAKRPRRPTAPRSSSESLETFIEKMRVLTTNAKPAGHAIGVTLESWDERLSSALAIAAVQPTAEHERDVAAEYRRLGVLDMAYAHLNTAAKLDPDDAATFDGLARIWRDWGFPHLGMPDAIRAYKLAPASPIVANTVGTLYQSRGQLQEARRWYSRAQALDPNASYATNNLCYTAIVSAQSDAVDECRRALTVARDTPRAHNNLALAYAAAGDLARARREFEWSDDPASVEYNMGIVFMGQRDFVKASAAFRSALRANPSLPMAAERSRQARALADTRGRAGAGESSLEGEERSR